MALYYIYIYPMTLRHCCSVGWWVLRPGTASYDKNYINRETSLVLRIMSHASSCFGIRSHSGRCLLIGLSSGKCLLIRSHSGRCLLLVTQ